MTHLILYLIFCIPNLIRPLLLLAAIIAILTTIIIIFIIVGEISTKEIGDYGPYNIVPTLKRGTKSMKKAYKRALYGIILVLVVGVSASFIPSQNQMLAIYLLPRLSNAKFVKNIPPLLNDYLTLEMKKLKKEMKNVN